MIRELRKVPSHQRVHIIDEVDDPDNPGKKIVQKTETTAKQYVKVMSERVAAGQLKIENERVALATHNLNLQEAVSSKDAEIEKLKAELAALKGEAPAPVSATEEGLKPSDDDQKPPSGKDLDLTNAQATDLSNAVNDLNKKGKGGK